MKTKTYRFGKTTCKTYCKTVGNGWETGFQWGTKSIFVGNFIHSSEATQWFNTMNREIRRFCTTYKVKGSFPSTWYTQFLKHHLYRTYYNHLDRLFTKYTRTYSRAFMRDVRKYRSMKRSWGHRPGHIITLKAA